MATEERAATFVRRADAALLNAGRIWESTIGAKSDEMRLHRMPANLDAAIRKVGGNFEAWETFEPSEVASVVENGPIEVVWVLSAHPSGAGELPVEHRPIFML